MGEGRFRNKIYWFTFAFSLLVIWVHSYNSELYLGLTAHEAVVWRMEHFLGDGVGQIAVPGFFMISAYLFFRSFAWNKLWDKWNSRIKSVLVPYIVWNLLYYMGYVIGSRLPVITEVVGKGTIPLNLSAAVEAVIHYEYNYVFWYLYQLILLIILAPAIYALMRNAWVGIVCLLLFLVGIYLELPLPQLNMDALFYYSAAAYAALHGRTVVESAWNLKKGAAGLAGIVCALLILFFGSDLRGHGTAVLSLVLFRFLTPVSLWFAVGENFLGEARPYMKHNFFLYAVHFAFVRFINKAGAMIFPGIPWISLCIYAVMPFLIVWISWCLGCFLRRFAPRVWLLLNGARG